MRVPPDELFHMFHPTTVAMAVAVNDMVDRLVADPCGEFAAAAFHVALPKLALENGPSNGDAVVGDCVASDIHLLPGWLSAAAPVT